MSDNHGGATAKNPVRRKKIIAAAAALTAVVLTAVMLILWFTVINPASPGVKTIKAEIVVPGDKIYSFKNASSDFDKGKKDATVYDYLMYLKADAGLEVGIDASGFVTGFYGYSPDRSTEYFKIYVNGKAANYGVKQLKLKDGEKYSFIPEKIKTDGTYTDSKYPDFLADSAYWLPSQGKKDVTVTVYFSDSRFVRTQCTTAQSTVHGLLDEITGKNGGLTFEVLTSFGTSFVNSVNGEKDSAKYYQVFCSWHVNWDDALFESNEYTDLDTAGWDIYPSGNPGIPGFVIFDGSFIMIKWVSF